MMEHNAQFYFANLGADIARCISAAEQKKDERYASSLRRAYKTLRLLRTAGRPEAYEEGLLLLRALEYAKVSSTLDTFSDNLSRLIRYFALASGG